MSLTLVTLYTLYNVYFVKHIKKFVIVIIKNENKIWRKINCACFQILISLKADFVKLNFNEINLCLYCRFLLVIARREPADSVEFPLYLFTLALQQCRTQKLIFRVGYLFVLLLVQEICLWVLWNLSAISWFVACVMKNEFSAKHVR